MKECLYCFKELTQRADESPSQFEIRKYCNRFCSSKRIGDLAKINKKQRKSINSPWFYNAA